MTFVETIYTSIYVLFCDFAILSPKLGWFDNGPSWVCALPMWSLLFYKKWMSQVTSNKMSRISPRKVTLHVNGWLSDRVKCAQIRGGPPSARVEISLSKPTKQSSSAVLTLLDDMSHNKQQIFIDYGSPSLNWTEANYIWSEPTELYWWMERNWTEERISWLLKDALLPFSSLHINFDSPNNQWIHSEQTCKKVLKNVSKCDTSVLVG